MGPGARSRHHRPPCCASPAVPLQKLPVPLKRPAPAFAPGHAAHGEWQTPGDGGDLHLHLRGDWRAVAAASLGPAPQAAVPVATVTLHAQALTHWDSGLAAALWTRLAPLAQAGALLNLADLPAPVRAVLELALSRDSTGAPNPAHPVTHPVTHHATASSAVPAHMHAPVPTHATAVAGAPAALAPWQITAQFFGEVLLSLGRLLRGRSDMRVIDFWRQLDQTGPLSLGIVTLSCFLVGLMLAYMGGAQLQRFGAPAYIADVVTVGMVRELAGLMTGIILSGRLGAAFAAQLGSMQANEEIDALRALGINPVDYLVLPRLLALLTVAPLVIAYAALVGILAGLPAATWVYGVPAVEYLNQSQQALTWTHIWIGLFKGTMYTALVALAGCREGLNAGRNAQAVGAATTSAVVKALVWIFAAACGSTIVFQSLGF
jgi:phospholipid/cholesterol/gamma-HCH transport system permease protein